MLFRKMLREFKANFGPFFSVFARCHCHDVVHHDGGTCRISECGAKQIPRCM